LIAGKIQNSYLERESTKRITELQDALKLSKEMQMGFAFRAQKTVKDVEERDRIIKSLQEKIVQD